MSPQLKQVPPLALTTDAERNLRRLGAALVLQWSSLPVELRDVLLDQAAEVEAPIPELKDRDGLKHLAENGWR